MDLRPVKGQSIVTMIKRDSIITYYTAVIGIFGHAVAKSNEDLKPLIANASAIFSPGFFARARNYKVIN